MSLQFKKVAINENNVKWENSIQRQNPIYHREDDIRTPFSRDYNRILHCNAYRRLKHKTQVFFATKNDHICTRIEHVNHVSSVSYTISKYLGLNTELTTAIATGHDVGHAPFGHFGETILKDIAKKDLLDTFWHERNSLRFIDKCETLTGPNGEETNLNLTYAVRDGIISHCGEVDEEYLFPRNEIIDLELIERPNQYAPFTWEGCIVKIADKIAYLGRDIEDALDLKILSLSQKKELLKIVKDHTNEKISDINNTVIMHKFIIDICKNSTPERGIGFTSNNFNLMKELREFSYNNIYTHERLSTYQKYAQLVIESIYTTLKQEYNRHDTINEIVLEYGDIFPVLTQHFVEWLKKYSNDYNGFERDKRYENTVLYDLSDRNHYIQAVIDFISGMTDHFAISLFNELTTF